MRSAQFYPNAQGPIEPVTTRRVIAGREVKVVSYTEHNHHLYVNGLFVAQFVSHRAIRVWLEGQVA